MLDIIYALTCDRCDKVETIKIVDIQHPERQVEAEGWTKTKAGKLDLCPRCSGNSVTCIDGRAVKLEPQEVAA